MLKVLDLFSGIGGFSLGLERAGMETVAFCEIEEYPRKVLAKHWPGVPIHKDIRKLDGTQYRGTVDVICGGFPCQPFSHAGKRGGKDDDRDLWPEMLRVIREVQPTWVIGENVAGFINMELDRTLSDLEDEGYACQTSRSGTRKGEKLLDGIAKELDQMWGTPTATDAIKGGKVSPRPGAMGLSEQTGGSLNPQWVEWLMGYPAGWTDLKD